MQSHSVVLGLGKGVSQLQNQSVRDTTVLKDGPFHGFFRSKDKQNFGSEIFHTLLISYPFKVQ